MPGRARGRMFDIRPEHDDTDTGTGSYPGYPGYGDDADPAGDGPGDRRPDTRGGAYRNGAAPNGAPQNGARQNGAPQNGAPHNGVAGNGAGSNGVAGNGAGSNGAVPAGARNGRGRAPGGPPRGGPPAGGEAATTAVRAVRGATGATPGPGVSARNRIDDRDERVAPDGRWDSAEPPLLSHRSDEPAYARDHTPQGFDGGDPDDPGWGRRNGYHPDDYYDDEDEPAAAPRTGGPRGPDDGHDDEYDDEYDDAEDGYDEDEYGVGDAPLSVPPPGSNGRPLGPADVEELDPSMTDALARVDLGSIQVPVPYGAEMKLEPSGGERPQAVHLLLPEGRIAVSALAAPRSSGLWADLAAEIEASLRKGGARVRNARGDWGRELHARTENAASVFVGCDGPRWMVYGVATASLETVDALDVELRRVLRGIIVVRGKSPYPPRTVLPLELPERLREEQPDAAPPKASITVSVPAPAPDDDEDPPGDAGATPAAAGTGGAASGPSSGATRRPGTRPTPVGPPARRPAEPVEPATRALPQVRRPAAGPAGPPERPAERTAVAGPPVRPESAAERTAVAGPPVRPDGPTGRTAAGPPADDAVQRYADRAIRPGRPRPGRPPRARRDPDPSGMQPAAERRTGAYPSAPPERVAATDRRSPLAPRDPLSDPLPPAREPVPGHRSGGDRSRDDRFADDRRTEDRFADDRGDRGRSRPQAADPVPAPPEPVEPPVRRDPAVTTLSAADLLAGLPADPATRDRSTGAAAAPAAFGTGAGPGTSGRGTRRRAADRAEPRGRTGREAAPEDDTPRGGYDLGPRRRPAADPLDQDGRPDRPAPRDRTPVPSGPMAIEDIPLADVPLMEAALDPALAPAPPAPPAPAPAPEPGRAPLPRRRRRDRTADEPAAGAAGTGTDVPAGPGLDTDAAGSAGRPAAGADESGWLSAEIAATRRSGRHGAGTGTGWSVADILASAGVGDPPRPARRDDRPADGPGDRRSPGDPVPGGDDLFRSPAEAGERYGDTPLRRERRHGAAPTEPGPVAADDRRNGHAPGPDGHAGPGVDGPRAGAAPTNGHAVTGLADYRRSRQAAADRDPAGPGADALDPPEPGEDPGTGRAAGGSGLTGQWSSGRRRGGTDPGDLGRHRRD